MLLVMLNRLLSWADGVYEVPEIVSTAGAVLALAFSVCSRVGLADSEPSFGGRYADFRTLRPPRLLEPMTHSFLAILHR